MRYTEELIQLAYLLRLSADTARDIGLARPEDFPEIASLAERARDIAADLESIARRMKPSN